jgi:hypothetical protein
MDIFTLLDESGCLSNLPQFVAFDLSKLPSFKVEDIDIFTMSTKLSTMEGRIVHLEASNTEGSNTNVLQVLRNIEASITLLKGASCVMDTVKIPSLVVNESDDGLTATSNKSPRLLNRVAQPGETSNSSRQSANSENNNLEGHDVPHLGNGEMTSKQGSSSWASVAGELSASETDNFITVKGKKFKENSYNRLRKGDEGGATSENSSTRQRKLAFVGTKTAEDNHQVKSAVNVVKKSVLHVDNLHNECSVEELKVFLHSSGINVLSCFNAKSWMRDSERDLVKSFRVCIERKDLLLCMSPSLWPCGVMVREWRFKGKAHNDAN